MLPSEFLNLYGKSLPRVVQLAGLGTHVIPPDEHRYVLVFLSTTLAVTLTPDSQDTGFAPGVTFGPGVAPIIFTHALHGSIVNLGWRVNAGGGATQFSYIEAFMKPLSKQRRRK